MKRFFLMILTVFAVILMSCQSQPKPDEVVISATKGWNSDNVSAAQIDTTLSYFSDDAVFKMIGFPSEIPAEFTGKEAIRAAYESWMPLHPKLQVEVIKVEGNTVTARTSYWSDPTRAMGVAPLVGTDIYVVENRKIVSETWTLEDKSQNDFAVAFAAAQASSTSPTPAPAITFPTVLFTNQGWGWEFKADGSYIAQGPGATEKGSFAVAGNQISVKGDYCGNVTGIYAWTYDGTTLTFTAVDDKCPDRAGTIMNNDGKWTRRP